MLVRLVGNSDRAVADGSLLGTGDCEGRGNGVESLLLALSVAPTGGGNGVEDWFGDADKAVGSERVVGAKTSVSLVLRCDDESRDDV